MEKSGWKRLTWKPLGVREKEKRQMKVRESPGSDTTPWNSRALGTCNGTFFGNRAFADVIN